MLLDRWIAPPDDASVPTRVRVDRHVLGGAKVLGWVLAVSLLGLHLPFVLFAYETVSLPGALMVGLSGLAALVAVRSARSTVVSERAPKRARTR
jgi:hypothetical protein